MENLPEDILSFSWTMIQFYNIHIAPVYDNSFVFIW